MTTKHYFYLGLVSVFFLGCSEKTPENITEQGSQSASNQQVLQQKIITDGPIYNDLTFNFQLKFTKNWNNYKSKVETIAEQNITLIKFFLPYTPIENEQIQTTEPGYAPIFSISAMPLDTWTENFEKCKTELKYYCNMAYEELGRTNTTVFSHLGEQRIPQKFLMLRYQELQTILKTFEIPNNSEYKIAKPQPRIEPTFPISYQNKELGFSLSLTEHWQGYEVFIEEIDNGKLLRFLLKRDLTKVPTPPEGQLPFPNLSSPKEGYAELFSISAIEVSKWDKYLTECKKTWNEKDCLNLERGRTNEYIFVMNEIPIMFPIPDIQLAYWDINFIVQTFKILQ